ncbi:helix-hairpin-helix domain-containing protein [Halosolutus halophilus]|uniref:helix-hairpin-helix domain-containing protein n=1 Tax=Halosolutus halophilus TaxID=1552990 RepID=UPI002234F7BB|nr:helix-hairpin-helix domain-containing protein [Halosolutus halophilus]
MAAGVRTRPDPKAEMEALGYDIVYKPHKQMAEYNAFYRVEYDGDVIAPPAARRMGVPLNEVWLTEFLRPYEKYVLYHELNEIKYRAEGYGVEEAHELALEADKFWADDPKWDELWREINLVPPARVCALPGFGEALFERIQHNRPYCDMSDLLEVHGIGRTRYERLHEEFWCFDCDL